MLFLSICACLCLCSLLDEFYFSSGCSLRRSSLSLVCGAAALLHSSRPILSTGCRWRPVSTWSVSRRDIYIRYGCTDEVARPVWGKIRMVAGLHVQTGDFFLECFGGRQGKPTHEKDSRPEREVQTVSRNGRENVGWEFSLRCQDSVCDAPLLLCLFPVRKDACQVLFGPIQNRLAGLHERGAAVLQGILHTGRNLGIYRAPDKSVFL